jgi:3-phytase
VSGTTVLVTIAVIALLITQGVIEWVDRDMIVIDADTVSTDFGIIGENGRTYRLLVTEQMSFDIIPAEYDSLVVTTKQYRRAVAPPDTAIPPPDTTVTPPDTIVEFDIQLTVDKSLDGSGQTVDTPTFFDAVPATQSLLFATGKGNRTVEVWRYPFDAQLDTIVVTGSPNGVAVDGARLYVGIYGTNPRVEVYALPGLVLTQTIGASVIRAGETNLGVLHPAGGGARVYVSDDTPRVLGFDVVTGQLVVTIPLSAHFQKVETVLCDDFHQLVFIPDEDGITGVHYFRPDGLHLGSFGASDFEGDAEGVALYDAGGGEGYLIFSDQKTPLSEFEFFDRVTHVHVGILKLTGVNNTDGIALSQQPSALFPAGVFAAQDDDTRVVLVSWRRVLDAIRSAP